MLRMFRINCKLHETGQTTFNGLVFDTLGGKARGCDEVGEKVRTDRGD